MLLNVILSNRTKHAGTIAIFSLARASQLFGWIDPSLDQDDHFTSGISGIGKADNAIVTDDPPCRVFCAGEPFDDYE
jgi:hypothetical protein